MAISGGAADERTVAAPGAAESWFEVTTDTQVKDPGGVPLGWVRTGVPYRSASTALPSDGDIAVAGPDGTVGYVPSSVVRPLAPPGDEPDRSAQSVRSQHDRRLQLLVPITLVLVMMAAGIVLLAGGDEPSEPVAAATESVGAENASISVENDGTEEAASSSSPALSGSDSTDSESTAIGVEGDLAEGLLSYAVLEGEPMQSPDAWIGGIGLNHVYGMAADHSAGTSELVVIERETGAEVARVPMGEPGSVIVDVEAAGLVDYLAITGVQGVVVWSHECACLERILLASAEPRALEQTCDRVWFDDVDPTLDVPVLRGYDRRTGLIDRTVSLVENSVVAERPWDMRRTGFFPCDIYVVDGERVWRAGVEDSGAATIIDAGPAPYQLIYDSDVYRWLGVGPAFGAAGTGEPRGEEGVTKVFVIDPFTAVHVPVFDDVKGHMWLSSLDSRVVAVNTVTLEVAFEHRFDEPVFPPASIDGYVWVPVGGEVIVIEAQSGEIVASLPGLTQGRNALLRLTDLGDRVWLHDTQTGEARTYRIVNR